MTRHCEHDSLFWGEQRSVLRKLAVALRRHVSHSLRLESTLQVPVVSSGSMFTCLFVMQAYYHILLRQSQSKQTPLRFEVASSGVFGSRQVVLATATHPMTFWQLFC